MKGEHGNLVIKSDGSYTYSITDSKFTSGTLADESTYKLVAPNGDIDTAKLHIDTGVNFSGSIGNDGMTSTAGADTFTSKTGADTVFFKVLNAVDNAGGNGHDTWTDFKKAEGDKIDISDLLKGQDINAANINQYVSVEKDGKGNTIISIDRDGQGVATHDKVELLTLKNTDVSLQDLLDHNQLIF